jgi:hypothetical protein
MRCFGAILSVYAVSGLSPSSELEDFRSFQRQYSKVYASEDIEAVRFRAWRANLEEIRWLNKRSTTFAINRFADMTPAERQARFAANRGRFVHSNPGFPVLSKGPSLRAAQTVDWRTKGAVSSVKVFATVLDAVLLYPPQLSYTHARS